MIWLYVLTGSLVAFSAFADRSRTRKALVMSGKRLLRITPPFLVMLVLVAVMLNVLPDEVIQTLLARENKFLSVSAGLALGSVSIMPGFIAFPLCGVLLKKGALYMTLAAFSASLMMVGVVTYPIERALLGTKLAITRNAVGFLIVIAVALGVGLVFGELV